MGYMGGWMDELIDQLIEKWIESLVYWICPSLNQIVSYSSKSRKVGVDDLFFFFFWEMLICKNSYNLF